MIRLRWLLKEIKWFMIGVLHVMTGRYFISDKHYGRFVLHNGADGNCRIRESIERGKPFAYCRYSYTEMDIMIQKRP